MCLLRAVARGPVNLLSAKTRGLGRSYLLRAEAKGLGNGLNVLPQGCGKGPSVSTQSVLRHP